MSRSEQIYGYSAATHLRLSAERMAARPSLQRFGGWYGTEGYPFDEWVDGGTELARLDAAIAALQAEREACLAAAPLRYQAYVQVEYSSSGPCYFLALRDPEGHFVPWSLWGKEEIERDLGEEVGPLGPDGAPLPYEDEPQDWDNT